LWVRGLVLTLDDTDASDLELVAAASGTPTPTPSPTPTSTPTLTPTPTPLSDSDGDGISDVDDNCPFVSNLSQTNSDGLSAGDACQCGDLNNDGVVNAADALLASQHVVGRTIANPSFDLARCNVIGEPDGGVSDCDIADIFVLQRFLAGGSVTVANSCDAYTGP
jgi:hypothetical protein